MKLNLSILVIILSLFPYVGLSIIPSDIQPLCMLTGIMWFVRSKNIKVNRSHRVQIIILIICALLLIMDLSTPVISVRSFTGYFSFVLLNIVFFNIIRVRNLNIENIFKTAIIIWFSICIVQGLINKSFMTTLIPHVRIGEERGLTGLAPEPSYLAVTGVFFYIISSHLLFWKGYRIISILIVVLSQSIFGMILLIPFLINDLLKILKIRNILSFFLYSSGVLTLIILFSNNNTLLIAPRLIQISSYLVNNPFDFFYLDASSSDRISHLAFSFKGFFQSFGIPNGFNEWKTYAISEFNKSNFKWITTGRIMSTYGSMLFELGIFGLILILTILLESKKNFKKEPLLFYGFNFMLLFAIPLATPLIPMIINMKSKND